MPLRVKLIHCGNVNIINPGDQGQKNIFFMPMGIFPLAKVLKEKGCDVEIIHLDLYPGKSLVEILGVDMPDMVGIDCHWINQGIVVLDTAEAIKKINPGVFIVLGGFTASLFAEEILAGYSQVDAVIRGDGEVPIVELAGVLHERRKENLKNVQNLVWRGKDGKVTANKTTYVGTAGEMEELDFAAVDMLRDYQSYKYLSRFWTKFSPICDSPLFLLEVGRGCRYACTFCGGNRVAQARMNNREMTAVRSIDSIVSTIKKAVSYGFETFYTCLEFKGSEEWYIKLFNRIGEESFDINFAYGCWGLPSKALLNALSKNFSNVIIEISPETANMELRKKNKDLRLFYTNEHMEESLDYVDEKGNIKIQLYFGYYLAGDTDKAILETIRYILTLLLKYPRLLEIEYCNFSTDPGSLFFFYPEKYDIDIRVHHFRDYIAALKENYIEKEKQPADMTLFKPIGISDEKDGLIRRYIYLLNYLFSFYRKTVSYIMEKTGIGLIMELLAEPGVSVGTGDKFPGDEIKNLLLMSAKKNDRLDPYLCKLIQLEHGILKKGHCISRPATQLYLDVEKENNFPGDEFFRRIKENDEKAISIDFDI